jgi:hypothetical protein
VILKAVKDHHSPRALRALGAFVLLFLHLAEDVGAVFDFFPDLVGDIDRGGLLDGHGDAVAGAPVELDDLAGVEFVFGADDEAGEVGFAFEIVDDDALDFRADGGEEVAHEIVGEGAFLGGLVHEHRDRSPNAFVHIDDEDFLFVPDKDCAAVVVGKNGANRHRDDLFHEAYRSESVAVNQAGVEV